MESKDKISLRQKAIKELIKTQAIEDQQKLIDLMKQQYGMEASQAAVSRDLRALGVSKKKLQDKMVYEIAEINISKEILRLAIVDVQHNETTIVVHTLPGLAAFVGDFLDLQHEKTNILGTLAGENIVLVIPKSIKEIKDSFKKVCKAIYFKM